MYPWWLYALTPRDQSQPTMRVWNQAQTATAAATTVNATFVVPQEYVAILNTFSMDARGGAGQNPHMMELSITEQGSSVLDWRYNKLFSVAAFSALVGLASDNLTGVMAGPGANINFAGVFTGGANANGIFVGLGAVLVPRGTIQVI